jgi:hypothetical protein
MRTSARTAGRDANGTGPPTGADGAVEDPRRRTFRAAVRARHDGTTDHLPIHQGGRIIPLTTFRKQRNNDRNEITRARTAAWSVLPRDTWSS